MNSVRKSTFRQAAPTINRKLMTVPRISWRRCSIKESLGFFPNLTVIKMEWSALKRSISALYHPNCWLSSSRSSSRWRRLMNSSTWMNFITQWRFSTSNSPHIKEIYFIIISSRRANDLYFYILALLKGNSVRIFC
jgi:hypothetical protein